MKNNYTKALIAMIFFTILTAAVCKCQEINREALPKNTLSKFSDLYQNASYFEKRIIKNQIINWDNEQSCEAKLDRYYEEIMQLIILCDQQDKEIKAMREYYNFFKGTSVILTEKEPVVDTIGSIIFRK